MKKNILCYNFMMTNIKERNMDKYVCTACMWVYDPAENNNVAFEDLPEDYVCPVCGVGKDMFEKSED